MINTKMFCWIRSSWENRIQIKDHGIWASEINKSSFSCFDDKIHILNNEYDGLTLGYHSWL